MRVALVYGTRPELVKLAVINELLGDAALRIHTGQHYDRCLSEAIATELGVAAPHVQLSIGGNRRAEQIGAATTALGAAFAECRPDAVVVQGDTNSALAGALAANAVGLPLLHVEAGLRSFDRSMPEEHNRVLIDHLADVCAAPTESARRHLVDEGIDTERIVVTGNTVVEAVQRCLPDPTRRSALLSAHGLAPNAYALVTIHRPENTEEAGRLEAILDELGDLGVPVVFPMHPRTRAAVDHWNLAASLRRLQVIEPVGHHELLGLMSEAALIISDSGGIQEEVSVVKRPLLVVRRSTERPEVLGTFAERVEPGPAIGERARAWLGAIEHVHRRLAALPSPYGDGTASQDIVTELERLVSRRTVVGHTVHRLSDHAAQHTAAQHTAARTEVATATMESTMERPLDGAVGAVLDAEELATGTNGATLPALPVRRSAPVRPVRRRADRVGEGRVVQLRPAKPARPSVSVIVPTLNEARNLPHVFSLLPKDVDEVVVIDGRSSDDTERVARALRPDVVVVRETRKGKGAALQAGFAASKGDILVMLDADGSADPREIPLFVDALLAGADFAKGSRFMAGGGSADITLLRRLGNLGLSLAVNTSFGARYSDLCYGYNVFWRHCLPYIDLDVDGFEVETLINIRVHRAGLKVVEVASHEALRLYGTSNLHAVRDGMRVLRTIVKERLRPNRVHVPEAHRGHP